MGNTASNPTAPVRPPMRIHQIHGKNLTIAQNRLSALRHEGYSDGLFFGSRPAAPGERLEIVINKIVSEWNGSLRFGFTTHSPKAISEHPEGIPRYMCPDLIKRGGSYVETLSQISLRARDRIVFWLESTGEACVKVNEVTQKCQIRGINRDVWPVVDVYGNTVDVGFRCLDDNMELHELSHSPRYYSSLKMSRFDVTGNISSLHVIESETIVKETEGFFTKAYAWNQKPLQPNTIWVLFVSTVDHSVGSGLSIAILKNEPTLSKLPEKLSDFPKLLGGGWVFENVYVRMLTGDELALCILQSGSVMVSVNGEKFCELGKVQPVASYYLVADMNCSLVSLTSYGTYRMTRYPLPKLPTVTGIRNSVIEHTNNRPAIESPRPVANNTPNYPSTMQTSDDFVNCCQNCHSAESDSVFIPCGDIGYCKTCADNLANEGSEKKCPICGKKYDSNYKVYL